MKLLIVAGEVSGDLYGATFAKALLQEAPQTVLYGVGGEHIKQVVAQFVYETAYSHEVGLKGDLSVWGYQPFLHALETFIQAHPIDKVILIDFSHQNFALAALFQKYNLPIMTWITPHSWMWKDQKKAKKIAAYSETIIAIFQKEYEFYRLFTDKVHYFGHPMVDIANPKAHRPSSTVRIALFPGSRKQELSLMLPKMLQIIQLLSQGGSYHFYLALSSDRFSKKIQAILDRFSGPKPHIWTGSKADLFAQTDFLICASGSATLEAMLYKVPMVILGALPPVTYWIAKLIFRIDKRMPYVALPNVIAGKEAVPEFVQNRIHPESVAAVIQELLKNTEKKQALLDQYEAILASLKPDGSPIKKTAKAILRGNRIL